MNRGMASNTVCTGCGNDVGRLRNAYRAAREDRLVPVEPHVPVSDKINSDMRGFLDNLRLNDCCRASITTESEILLVPMK
jgi:hypothetical protein